MDKEKLFYFGGCVSSMIQFVKDFGNKRLESFAFGDFRCNVVEMPEKSLTHILCSKHSGQPALHADIISTLDRLCLDIKAPTKDEKEIFDVVVAEFIKRKHTFLTFQSLPMAYNRPFLFISAISMRYQAIGDVNFYGCIAFYKDR